MLAVRWNARVRASRVSLAEIASRYPVGSPSRAMAVRREITRRLHPRWTDLSISEIAERVQKIATRAFIRPHDTASSGNSSEIAPFLGDYTAITSGAADGFLLLRQSDCSFTYDTGTFSRSLSSPGYTITGSTAHYEATLHQLAGMTTTGGAFPSGCTPINGSATRALFLGKTSENLYAFASDGYDPSTQNNALYYGTIDSSYNYHSLSVDDSNPNIHAIATGDLNKDGNGDIIELTFGACHISVLMGKSDGTFESPVQYSCAGSDSQGAVVADFNGDGNPDVAVISRDGNVTIFLGAADGTLHEGQALLLSNPSDFSDGANLIAADLRGNGRKDIVLSDGTVLLSNGDGTFSVGTKIVFPTSGATSEFGPNLAAGDLNKDGKTDLVYDDGYSIDILLGNGDGTFTAGKRYATIDNVGYITITDIDGDGNLDIYTGMAGGPFFSGDQFDMTQAYVLLGNGDGTFQGAPVAPASYTGSNLADINGDGKMDLVSEASSADYTSVNFTTYLGQKDGSFATTGIVLNVASITVSNVTHGATTYTSPGVNSFALADVNGDGRADLLFLTNSLTSYYQRDILCVALANSDGSFAQPNCLELPSLLSNPSTLPTGGPDFDFDLVANNLHIVDLNGDGKPDLLYSYQDSDYGTSSVSAGFIMQPGNGDGTFGAPKILQLYTGSSAPTTVPQFSLLTDLSGDGLPDLVTTLQAGTYPNYTTTAYINLNNGDGSFNSATSLTLSSVESPLAAADMNHDGKNDLVVVEDDASAGYEKLVTYPSNGDGTFATPVATTLSNADVISLVIADFNGDGKLDVAILSYENYYNGIYFGNGDGTVQTLTDTFGDPIPGERITLNVGGPGIAYDFDGDGKLDMLAGDVYLHAITAPSVATVGTTASTTALSVSPTSATTGESVTLTATVTGPSGNSTVPTGTVSFYDGAAPLGTGTLDPSGKATFSTSSLGASTHSLTVVYAGDTTFSASTSSAVSLSVTTVAVGTTTTLSPSATSAARGTSLTFTATVSPASGNVVPSGTVTFLDGSTSIGSGTLDGTGKAIFATSTLSIGSHSIMASYGGDSTFSSSNSSAQTITITGPDFSLSLSPSNGSETKSSAATSTVTVTASNGFNLAVTFSCSGLPAGLSCSFNPSAITPSGSTPAATTLTISGTLSASRRPPNSGDLAEVVVGCFGVLFFARRRRLRALPTLVLAILVSSALVDMQGCSGSSSSAKTSTNTITITGSSQNLSHTVTYTLLS
jgi:hypothetical protein